MNCPKCKYDYEDEICEFCPNCGYDFLDKEFAEEDIDEEGWDDDDDFDEEPEDELL